MKKDAQLKKTEDLREHLEEFKRLSIFLDENIVHIQTYIDKQYAPMYQKIKVSATRLLKHLLQIVKQGEKTLYNQETLPAYIKELICEFYLLLVFDSPFCEFLGTTWDKLQKYSGKPTSNFFHNLLNENWDIENFIEEEYDEEEAEEDDDYEDDYEEISDEMEEEIQFLHKTLSRLEAPIDPTDTCQLPEGISLDIEISLSFAPFPRSLFTLWLAYLKHDLLLLSTIPVIRNRMKPTQLYKYQKGIQRRKEAKDYPALIALYLEWIEIILDKINQHPERIESDLNRLVEILENMTHKNTRQALCYPFQHTHYLLGSLLWKEQEEIGSFLERKQTELLYHLNETETLNQIANHPERLKETILKKEKTEKEQDTNIHFSWS